MKNVYLLLIQALMALNLVFATGCSKGGIARVILLILKMWEKKVSPMVAP